MIFWQKIKRWLAFNLRYFGNPAWDTGVSPPELIAVLDSLRPGNALDVGCGTGTNLLTMAERGWDVTGLDFVWLSVLKARRKIHQAGYEACVLNRDVTGSLALDEPFDFVLDIGCFHALIPEDRRQYRKNLDRWLKPGGTYLIYAHNKRSPESSRGIQEADITDFQSFLTLVWRSDGEEARPDGGGGFPALWSRFQKPD
jgi:cyclopropane fatty-acyl-phospholipid synthase-like methyltransferase